MKRFLSLLLSVMMLFTALPTSVFAEVNTATVTIADANGDVGDTIFLQVKLNTSGPVDSIALRDLVYDDEVLEFVGFGDYSAIEAIKAVDFTLQTDPAYASFGLKPATEFSTANENICTLKFNVLKADETNVSLTAVIKDDAVAYDVTLNQAVVNEAAKTATVTIGDANATVGDIVSLPVKLNTSAAVDSIALKDFVFDSEYLEFKGFADYSALEAISTLDVTLQDNPIYASFALKDKTVFDSTNENIVSLKFSVLKAGTPTVSLTAVVKDNTEEFTSNVDPAEVSAVDPVIEVTSVTLNETEITLTEGGTFKLNAKVLPENATNQTVTWSSDDDGVASVADGLVTAVSEGTAVITAAVGTVTAECTVTVKAKEIAKSAALVIDDESGKVGQIVSLPVKLTTTTAVNSIALRDFVFDSEYLKFEGFADYSAIEAISALEVTTQKDPAYASFALKSATIFDDTNKNIITLKFSILKEGISTVSFTAVVKNEADEIEASVDGATVTAEAAEPTVVPVESVTLNKTTVELIVDSAITLTATVLPKNATNKDVTWESNNPEVAKVENGTVTALKVGTATITAKANNGVKAECVVTVEPIEVESVSFNMTSNTIKVGENFTLTANVLPANATDKTVTWESNNPEVAKVENGTVTALKVGTATITATSNNGKKAECAVTVKPTEVESVTLNKTTVELIVDSAITLTATVLPKNATNKDVTWESNNPEVAKVENGTVTALKVGTATITAKANNGVKAECVVTVKPIEVESVTLNETTAELTVDSAITLTATVLPEKATDKTVTWESSNPEVAKVENGTVTALKAGTATITAKAGNKTATCEVTVNAKALTGDITIISDGDVLVYSDAFGEAVKGTDYEVKWYRDGAEVAVTGDSYTVTEADYGKTITVKAIANGTTYAGEFSDEIVIPAKAPSDVSISAIARSESIAVTLSAKANGSKILRYHLTITDNAAYSDGVVVEETNGAFSHTFTGLENGTEYTIKAIAENSVGSSGEASTTATPKKRTNNSGNTTGEPIVIRPANPGTEPVKPDTPDVPGNSVEVKPEGDKATVSGNDLKDKDSVKVEFEGDKENGKVNVEVGIKDKGVTGVTVVVKPKNVKAEGPAADEAVGTPIVVEVEAKDSNGEDVDVPVDVTIESEEEVYAYEVDQFGNTTRLDSTYDAENGVVEIKNVENGSVVLLSKKAPDTFDDDDNRWSEPEIEKAHDRGLVVGKAPRIFDPLGNLTRHESNKLHMNLINSIKAELARTEESKIDTAADHWAYASDEWTVAVGIIKGTAVLEDGTVVVSGTDDITRQDYMTSIARMIKTVGGDAITVGEAVEFADAADIADYAKDAVALLSSLGIVKGNDDGMVNPRATITREEAVSILNRVYDVVLALTK